MSRRLLAWVGIVGGIAIFGGSLGMMSAAHFQNRVLVEKNRTLTLQLKQERRVVHLAPVGPETDKKPTEKFAQIDFCPVDLQICRDIAKDAEQKRKQCEKELAGVSAKKDQLRKKCGVTWQQLKEERESNEDCKSSE
ncbi:TPA: hypothetical protein HA238_05195 [Candidatus Micrarchaeota archaeon]|nr:hypothetical protein [Candidatus Micrarchaeota archaeon]